MHDLKIYLENKFRKPINEVSKTEFDNTVIDKNLEMIHWDDVATHFYENNNEFREKFSSADGLVIIEKEDKDQLFFFEFKNIDYSKEEDRQMAVFHLKKSLKRMKECNHDCEVFEDLEKISEYLVDKSNASLRSKPSDSISLFYHIMKDYYEIKNDDEARDKLFNTEKFFFLVTNTPYQYLPFKNKSNRKSTIIKQLELLKRFVPYHYNGVFAVNKSGFERYFYKHNEEYLNN